MMVQTMSLPRRLSTRRSHLKSSLQLPAIGLLVLQDKLRVSVYSLRKRKTPER
jgi:hypothetical protein